jgi:ribosomal protein S18 acetylase RimI-like enzyme
MKLPNITIAKNEDRDRVISVITAGFITDPAWRWFFPEAKQYLSTAPSLFDAFGGAAIESKTAFVTENFEGAALWLAPGIAPDEDSLVKTLEENVSPTILQDVLGVLERMDKYHPEEDVWYLPLIAVDPAHQGRGLGSALMKAALEKCDKQGLPAYLESSNPRNIALYERHGFDVMGEIQVGTSPVITPMLRVAR